MSYGVTEMLANVVWTSLFLVIALFEVVSGGKCYKEESLGDAEGNVYFCNAAGLTRCCTENSERTCCVEIAEKNMKEQLQLWGIVAGMIILIAILFICCKNDISFCNSDLTLKERCYRCRNRGKNKKAHTLENEKPGQYYDNPAGDFGDGPSNNYYEKDPYKFPPLPPIEELKGNKMYSNQSYA
uniref:Uncharacterized protein n=1 Tax=Biomphalaria glabrata TaxID=6526 RepID=A0A2C9LRK7_BIOGL